MVLGVLVALFLLVLVALAARVVQAGGLITITVEVVVLAGILELVALAEH